MALTSLSTMRDHLSLTSDMGGIDDALIVRLLGAAEGHVERLLGYGLHETFIQPDGGEIPPALTQAICELTAWWYEQRETAVVGATASEVPFGVAEIVREYREYTF